MHATAVDSDRGGTKLCSAVVERQRQGMEGLSAGRGAGQECWQERRAGMLAGTQGTGRV